MSATRIPDLLVFRTLTDGNGEYRLAMPAAGREYLVLIRTIGFKPFRQHVDFGAGDTTIRVDANLVSSMPQQLETVETRAEVTAPSRTPNQMIAPPGAARSAAWAGVTAGLAPDQMGDLNARLTLVPGMSGGSFLGLDPSANGVMLEGLAFSGARIPRGADVYASVGKSEYDPSLGQYSGALTDLTLEGASLFKARNAYLTLDAPGLEYNDPVAAHSGHRFFSISPSLSATGATLGNRVFYNMSAQYTRRETAVSSLLNPDADVLYAAGLAPDSAVRALALARGAGIPVASGLGSRNAISNNATFLARFDTPQSLQDPGRKRIWSLLLYGNLSRAGSPGASALSTPSQGGASRSSILRAQLRHSAYFGPDNGWLNDFRSGFTTNLSGTSPWVPEPAGRVLISSDMPDGTNTLSTIAVGGPGGGGSRHRSWTWETTNTTQWYPSGPSNQLKLYFDSRLDGFKDQNPGSDLGVFSYNSLADLSTNQPTSYVRALRSPIVSGREWYGAVALGDIWRKSPTFAMEGGLRLEGNHFLDAPPVNPAIEAAFGVRNSAAPNSVHVSPRLGFSWVLARRQTLRSGSVSGDLTGNYYQGPYGVLRGGIGEWRGPIAVSLIAGPESATGLPGARQTLRCIGTATPVPDWAAVAADPDAIPSQCAGGAPGVLEDAAPGVQLLDPSYTAGLRRGANLAWTGRAFGFRYGIDATYALTLNQPTLYDLNFFGVPQFVLSAEGGRPVFVTPGSIVSATGAVSPVEARRDTAFGSVSLERSDGRGTARQLTLKLSPEFSFGGGPAGDSVAAWKRYVHRTHLSVAYTFADNQVRTNGFNGTTGADPRSVQWGPNPRTPQHQFIFQLGLPTFQRVSLGAFATLQSGLPYTPLVGGDVNGDGRWNDRAFAFDPGVIGDPDLDTQVTSLLATAPTHARSCLLRQLGEIVAPNSCHGPWTMALNLRVSTSYPIRFGYRTARVSLNFANPLGGLDLLLHGADHLHGWGTTLNPDPTLYSVRGFDPGTQTFRYKVNPRFGSTSVSQSTLRGPFRVTLDVSFDLSTPYRVQLVERSVSLATHLRDDPLAAVDTVSVRFASMLPDIYDLVVRQADSLFLSEAQIDSLRTKDIPYRRAVDSLINRFAQYIVTLPQEFDLQLVVKEEDRIVQLGWNMARDQRAAIKSVLSAQQYDALRGQAIDVLETEGDVKSRFGVPIF